MAKFTKFSAFAIYYLVRIERETSMEEEARKRRKKMNNEYEYEKEDEEEDRLSNLPDRLIHYILSFLNTKYAVQTSVLSKRWVFVWKSLPYLDFNFSTFPYKASKSESRKANSFVNLVFHVLSRRCPNDLVKVRYSCLHHKPSRRVAIWLMFYAVEHNVQELEVNQCGFKPVGFHLSFCTCKSLKVLNLKLNHGSKLPEYLALPALKSLCLDGFSLKQKDFDPKIFSGCPNLETLKLVDILFGNLKCFRICSLNLRNLEFSFSEVVLHFCKVVIDAPRLTSFKYVGYASMLCSMEKLASVDQVFIDLHWNACGPREEDMLCLINILEEFRQAKCLKLSSSTKMVLCAFPGLLEGKQLRFADSKDLDLRVGSDPMLVKEDENLDNKKRGSKQDEEQQQQQQQEA